MSEMSRKKTHPDPPADVITSRDNKWLKNFRAALRGTGPAKDEPIVLEGPKLVEEAIRAGFRAEALLVSDSGDRDLPRILRAAAESEAGIARERIFRTTDRLFAGVVSTETPQGIAALFHPPKWEFEDVLRGAQATKETPPLIVVAAGVQDPGNVGTVLRSAEAFGATGFIAARGTADPWSPKALRASAGSALRLPLLRGLAIPILLAQLKMQKIAILAATSHGNESSRAADEMQKELQGPVAIFIGSEGSGLPAEILHVADCAISIPMSGHVESLNAGIAASILLYEAARQRSLARRP